MLSVHRDSFPARCQKGIQIQTLNGKKRTDFENLINLIPVSFCFIVKSSFLQVSYPNC